KDILDPIAYQDEACAFLALEKNAIVRELYATKLAEEINASPETVMQEIERRHQEPDSGKRQPERRQPEMHENKKDPARNDPTQQMSREELYLLGLIAAEPSLVDEIDIRVEDFSEGPIRNLAERVLPKAIEGNLDPSGLIELCGDLTVRDYSLHDLMARVCMRLDELFGHQDLRKAATEQLWRQRKYRLRCRLDTLKLQLDQDPDEKMRSAIKQELLQVTRQLTELKQKPDG
ncbi:MAG: hypothetical protein SCM11_15445, partial [Bacillota bacterium]|nr:hypothetical protein [Bacillota bacterium]